MNKKSIYTLFCLSLLCTFINAQDKKKEKAESDYNNYDYILAIDSYEKLVADGYSDEQIYKDLGNANYQNARYSEASQWYEKLFNVDQIEVESELMYRYAQSLKSTGNYKDSKVWMNKYMIAKNDDVRAIKLEAEPDYLTKIEENSGTFKIENLAINSNRSDFAPSFKGQDLIFSTSRDSGITRRNIHSWNGESFTNLYKALANDNGDFTSVEKLPKIFNKKTHESSTAYTKDGKTVYFTRNNSINGNFARDDKGVSRLKIYRATLMNDEWTDIIELPFNSENHSVAHPTLSSDERRLYFASDMKGTIGESDIFVVDINEDGSFSTPKNLGPGINTESRETFPYVSKEDLLYFSSDGHPGLGGLDIFVTRLTQLNTPFIVNLGKPINTKEDDFSFIFNSDTQKGFFASNRPGGKGSDDIYGIVQTRELELDCHVNVAGVVKDQLSDKIISNAKVMLLNATGTIISEGLSDEEGNFAMQGDCENGDYKAIASKVDYLEGEKMYSVHLTEDVENVVVYLAPERKSAPIGTDLTKYLNLEPIYFDFDKWNIRDDASISIRKVIDYMKAYPEIKVEVQSHTDIRGDDDYNEALSQKRAESTSSYMIELGIEPSRISSKGFGEKRLVFDCGKNVNCSEANHQENRRSEFIVIE
ncbi:OmpA family protein [Aurantibacter crassamenti]|uniref:OmpA family protein n=1 Tax=Aurantibacter crassamenti TaxID=1837375 RepID=UPI0019395D53|nr:OmpA family protein [Aurantibacter crassamenti]MBM1105827.1 OmpA family protein [Aurantibacter crassamenti]